MRRKITFLFVLGMTMITGVTCSSTLNAEQMIPRMSNKTFTTSNNGSVSYGSGSWTYGKNSSETGWTTASSSGYVTAYIHDEYDGSHSYDNAQNGSAHVTTTLNKNPKTGNYVGTSGKETD